MSDNKLAYSGSKPLNFYASDSECFTTCVNLYDVIKIDSKGFYYKDEFIEDAGKAYDLFIEVMERKRQ